MIADFAEYRANYEFSSGGLASAQRLDVKLRAAGRRLASSGAPLAAHPIMPVQAARRRVNSRRRSRLGRREKRGRTVNFNAELGARLLEFTFVYSDTEYFVEFQTCLFEQLGTGLNTRKTLQRLMLKN